MNQNLPIKDPGATIAALFERPAVKNRLVAAMPKWLNPDRLLRLAVTAIRNNPMLLKCTQKSLLSCVMGCATLGLEPEPFLGQVYFVPYYNKKIGGYEAQLIPGYRGYLTLARRSGEVQSVQAQCVYENDQFELKFGLEPKCDLLPAEGDRGGFKGAFVIFTYKDGSYSFDYMPKLDIDAIRDRSKAKTDGPWVTDYAEMAKKTVIRRHVKVAPLSVEIARTAVAENLAIAGESQVDFLYPGLGSGDGGTEYDRALNPPEFDDLVAREIGNDTTAGPLKKSLDGYVEALASANSMSADALKAEAVANWPNFWDTFIRWREQIEMNKPPYTARNSKAPEPEKKEPPARTAEAPKRVADMSGEELVIHRIKKASKTTIERVVENNLEDILASQEATELAMDKWSKNVDKPWPGIDSEVVKDGDNKAARQPDSSAIDLIINARDMYDTPDYSAVDAAAEELGVDVDNPTITEAGRIHDRAAQIYDENEAAAGR